MLRKVVASYDQPVHTLPSRRLHCQLHHIPRALPPFSPPSLPSATATSNITLDRCHAQTHPRRMNRNDKQHIMKKALLGLNLILGLTLLSAQEIVPLDQAEKAAVQLVGQTARLKGLPSQVDADPAKAFAMTVKSKGYASLVLPDKALSKEALAASGKTVTPLGQLWLNKLTPAVQAKGTPADQLNLVDVTFKDKEQRLVLLLLGAQNNDAGELELVVYGKDKRPLLRLPLRKSSPSQELPLELDMRPGGEALGTVDIKVLGAYEAALPVAELEL
jgi:hypothetical protein